MAITDFDRWIDAYEEAKPQRSTATTTPSRAGAIDALQDHSADDVAPMPKLDGERLVRHMHGIDGTNAHGRYRSRVGRSLIRQHR